MSKDRALAAILVVLALLSLPGCASMRSTEPDRSSTTDRAGSDEPADRNYPATRRDKTKKGAIGGAIAGAVAGAVIGEGEADEILAGAVIGAGIGAGIGAYMDRQEEKLAAIPGTTIERVSDDVILMHMDADVLFESNSSLLTSDAQLSLDRAANVLVEYPKTAIVVQGHSDETGNEALNLELSQRRAEAVRAYLIGRGVDAARLTAVGYGASQAGSYANNRRVDILLKAKAA